MCSTIFALTQLNPVGLKLNENITITDRYPSGGLPAKTELLEGTIGTRGDITYDDYEQFLSVKKVVPDLAIPQMKTGFFILSLSI